jgi:hypothetical protein
MRVLTCCLVGVILACLSAAAPTDKPEPTAESKWARGVADDFWRAQLCDQNEQAAALLSPELAKSLVTDDWSGAGKDFHRFVRPAQYWLSRQLPDGLGVVVTFEAEESSPDRSEVVFRGRLAGKDVRDKLVAADFTMRVARESASGKWSIRFLLVTDHKEPQGKSN